MYKHNRRPLQGQFIIPGGSLGQGVTERRCYSSHALQDSSSSPCSVEVKSFQARKREEGVGVHSRF